MRAMKKIHQFVISSLSGVLIIGSLSSCSGTGRDYANAAQVESERVTRSFHPSRRTQGSSARLLLEKPDHEGERKAPTRGFHPSRRP